MNIAMFGHKNMPDGDGGVEVVVEELSRHMAAKGHSVTCYNRTSPQSHSGVWKGVRLVNVPTIDKRGLAAVSSSVFASILAAFGKYDVVHIHAEGPAFMAWLPRLMGKRVIVTVHGLDHQRAKWGKFASWYIRTGEKNAVRFAHEIIVLSKGVQEYFSKTYGRKTIFLNNGISVSPACEAEIIRERWELEKDGYILYLARLVPEKGLRYLINAFKQVNTDKKLVIAGSSSDTDGFVRELREMAADDPRILFTDMVKGRAKAELFANAYLYTLPSDLEGMPLTLLEAMSYGNCCLVSDIPECAEVVKSSAVLFHKGNTEDLARKLQMLCDEPETVLFFRKSAPDVIGREYDWVDVTERTLALYEKKN